MDENDLTVTKVTVNGRERQDIGKSFHRKLRNNENFKFKKFKIPQLTNKNDEGDFIGC